MRLSGWSCFDRLLLGMIGSVRSSRSTLAFEFAWRIVQQIVEI
jgi:hypothetical protein